MAISIVLADDHALVRRGMKALFESEPDFSVIAEAGDGLQALQITEALHPDVLVLDLMLPGMPGLEVLHVVRQKSPRTRVVMISVHKTTSMVSQALQNGATGYVLKGNPETELLDAVRAAGAGRRYISTSVPDIAVRKFLEQSPILDPHDTLTLRQREVLCLTAEGKTSAEIGEILKISPRTVENHRAMLMDRLGLKNHTDLIVHALRHGIIPEE
ncbi:MAG TPA: response regulator transcription factor [Bryobacteraceae bacterium]|nr:response regulator transcription factor [Bryobacteraceae bacterium]